MAAPKTKGQRSLKKWLSDHERSVTWFARMIGVTTTTMHSWLALRSRPGDLHAELIEALTGNSRHDWLTAKEKVEWVAAKKRIADYHKANTQ
jgi:hypothetical protein